MTFTQVQLRNAETSTIDLLQYKPSSGSHLCSHLCSKAKNFY